MNQCTRSPSASLRQPLPHDAVSERIAAILRERGRLTDEQLLYARRVQAKLQGDYTLIQVLKELGYLKTRPAEDRLDRTPTREGCEGARMLTRTGHSLP